MSTRTRVAGRIGLVALIWTVSSVHAGDTIYRCTDADGTVTLQNTQPCASGQRQDTIAVDVPPPFPAFVPPPVAHARPLQVHPVTRVDDGAGDGHDAAADSASEPAPPPPLFQCRRWDGEHYTTEDDTPATRCRPLNTVGIGGLPELGAGQACEQVVDVCEPVPGDVLCRAWSTRVQEAEFRWKMAPRGVDARDRQAEYARLAALHEGSTCAAP
jgi:hypothetical protein